MACAACLQLYPDEHSQKLRYREAFRTSPMQLTQQDVMRLNTTHRIQLSIATSLAFSPMCCTLRHWAPWCHSAVCGDAMGASLVLNAAQQAHHTQTTHHHDHKTKSQPHQRPPQTDRFALLTSTWNQMRPQSPPCPYTPWAPWLCTPKRPTACTYSDLSLLALGSHPAVNTHNPGPYAPLPHLMSHPAPSCWHLASETKSKCTDAVECTVL
jgi:hypothetical protein